MFALRHHRCRGDPGSVARRDYGRSRESVRTAAQPPLAIQRGGLLTDGAFHDKHTRRVAAFVGPGGNHIVISHTGHEIGNGRSQHVTTTAGLAVCKRSWTSEATKRAIEAAVRTSFRLNDVAGELLAVIRYATRSRKGCAPGASACDRTSPDSTAVRNATLVHVRKGRCSVAIQHESAEQDRTVRRTCSPFANRPQAHAST